MSTYRSPSQSSTTKRITTTIHDEVTWGMMYRNQNAKKNDIPLQLACSPINIHQFSIDKMVKQVCIHSPPEELSPKVKKRSLKKRKCINTTNLHAGRVDLLRRSILNQKQYMKILAVPNIRCFNKPTRRRKRKWVLDRCSPRIVKLALPSKNHVLGTWKEHQYFLPSEFIQRLHNLLYTGNNINIKDVRYYFKRCDKRRRRLKIALRKKKRRREQYDMMWMDCEVRNMARLIVNYFIEEPVLDLSYKQLLISSILMNFMGRTGKIRQPLTRSVKKSFPLTIIEICDKLAVWVDNVVRLVDFQPIDDEEELPEEMDDWGSVEEEEEEEEYNDMDYEEV